MTILIPACKPDKRLVKLINSLKKQCDYDIVVVDDGSGPDYADIFNEVSGFGCKVLTREESKGKGAALKTGFCYIQKSCESTGVVTVDWEGQYSVKDIMEVAKSVKKEKPDIVLGIRRFSKNVPLRNRFGNLISRTVFSFVSGARVHDTQTGLRGFSIRMIPWLCEISGDSGYEYEMNMLMEAVQAGFGIHEVDIETVYSEQEKLSHFQILKDSLHVYLPIIKFGMSSLISGLIDFVLLIIIEYSTKNLFLAVVGARVCSALFNYSLNRHYVFSNGKEASMKTSLPKYVILAVTVMLVNYNIINLYYSIIGIPLIVAKILTESTIFIFSYFAQRKFVFAK